jgi:hypothetical protein
MLKIKNLRGECQLCGGPIEFHAEHVGTTATCPHCSQPTELLLAAPPEEKSLVSKKAVVFTVIAVVILVSGLVAANIALQRAERLWAGRRPVPPVAPAQPDATAGPFAVQGFRISAVALEPGQGSSLVYAVGTITNTSNRQRFGVKVELELCDAEGHRVGGASDYLKVLEPGAGWKFRAVVVEKRAVGVRVAGIKEDK